MKTLKKLSVILAFAVFTSFLTVNAESATEVGDWSALKRAIQDETVSDIRLTGNISGADSDLGTQGATNLTVDGDNHTLTGGDRKGIIVETGQNLTIRNINNKGDMSTATAGEA